MAGRIILQNGGETYRVEDTMARIAAAYGIEDPQCFVMPTGIIFAISGASQATRLFRINERNINLGKVALVNDISRRITSGTLQPVEALASLKELEKHSREYPAMLKVLAAAVASGCFLIMFQGSWSDFFPVFVTGGLGFLFFLFVHSIVQIKFFAEFLTALLIGTTAVLFVKLGLGHNLDQIIIGSVMPLVPGLHITNAVRDLMAGHLVSGLSKGAEAFLTAFAIGSGIATILSIFY
ncbi:threonine/serine exporter family protein [Paenibacillus soyae]|uniref:Threonine/serine exporter family protein n=1 Tax=Paenibacillus soyae TaxID=2969249 RepID=A0A9X2S8K0_9BACL|nr:threonine/serine exporter family protein [Paenibacillus soyae]MCR2804305.1 threonine/serine exporter family protein [Paenibacillus soyae]